MNINISTPIAVVAAGALIAGAVLFTGRGTAPQGVALPDEVPSGQLDAIQDISKDDHILGNPDAPIKIVEFSDFECPFCKRFHGTMLQVMDEYGADGQVAWVYRHFPLDQLHPVKARKEAVASECAAELGGNDAFWKFANRFFELTPSNNQTDIDTVLPQIAREIGLNVAAFNDCIESDAYDDHIREDSEDATTTGGRGTPWSVIVVEDGDNIPINGAQSFESVKALIDAAL